MRAQVYTLAVLVGTGSLLALAAREAGPLPGDLACTRFLQGLAPAGAAGLLLTYAGDAVWLPPTAALVVALLWRRWAAALFVTVATVTGLIVGVVLKFHVARPRPPAELAQRVTEGYSFPSSTAFLSVVTLGVVCYLVRSASRRAFVVALAASLVLVLAVGLSRVYVGEHWATDVLGGWLFGGAWLILLVVAYRRFDGRASEHYGRGSNRSEASRGPR